MMIVCDCLNAQLHLNPVNSDSRGGTANLSDLAHVRDIRSLDEGRQIQGEQEILTTKRMPELPKGVIRIPLYTFKIVQYSW